MLLSKTIFSSSQLFHPRSLLSFFPLLFHFQRTLRRRRDLRHLRVPFRRQLHLFGQHGRRRRGADGNNCFRFFFAFLRSCFFSLPLPPSRSLFFSSSFFLSLFHLLLLLLLLLSSSNPLTPPPSPCSSPCRRPSSLTTGPPGSTAEPSSSPPQTPSPSRRRASRP